MHFSTTLPRPLAGPKFGSYQARDVRWLLKDLSNVDLERDVAAREMAVQMGQTHYSESLPIEYQPPAEYRELYDKLLAAWGRRTAELVHLLALRVVESRQLDMRGVDAAGRPLLLVSLARAGTPVGILLSRWFARQAALSTGDATTGVKSVSADNTEAGELGLVQHVAVSIIRDKGLDMNAMRWIAANYDPRQVVFVDGWTGKGAITRELASTVAELNTQLGTSFDPTLAVLADPAGCTPLHATSQDTLIPSACLNSTVSGLVSRTVHNRDLIGEHDFHGAKFYQHLAADDVSRAFVDTVASYFSDFDDQPPAPEPVGEVDWRGWAAVEMLAERYGVSSVHRIKPGLGETTRVLLRRVPGKILVESVDNPAVAHVLFLADEKKVPVEEVPGLPYAAVGLIQDVVGDSGGVQ